MKHRIIRKADGTIDTWATCAQAGREYAAQGILVEGAASLVIGYQRAVGLALLTVRPGATEIDLP